MGLVRASSKLAFRSEDIYESDLASNDRLILEQGKWVRPSEVEDNYFT
jgi:hypothetical protein